MTAGKTALDPILAQALQMEHRPVVQARAAAALECANLMESLERIGSQLVRETDPKAQGQLSNICESLGVLIIGLMAYSRGLTPRVASKKPDTNIIVQ